MSRQLSPFAELTGDEKQIKWLEYQSLRLPYIQADAPAPAPQEEKKAAPAPERERPQPPPEIPRVMPAPRHSQYDAVIARMKQAELQSRRSIAMSQAPQ